MDNTNIFSGMALMYDQARPALPKNFSEIIESYLEKKIDNVLDVGCGTGLSIKAWAGRDTKVTGTEPSSNMREIAEEKYRDCANVTIIGDAAEKISVSTESADLITCVQAFHWFDRERALTEFNRILKPGGAVVACDFEFPPMSIWQADKAYTELLQMQAELGEKYPVLNSGVSEGDKSQNLSIIRNSGYFNYSRELYITLDEDFSAERYIQLAFSQSIMQRIKDNNIREAIEAGEKFKATVRKAFGEKGHSTHFSIRLCIAVKA